MTDERRPTDWPDERLADAFMARAAARPTPPDLASATLERVRGSSPRSPSRPWRYSFGALAATAVIVVAVAAIAIGRPSVEPGEHPSTAPGSLSTALGLPVVSVVEAIAIRDADLTDREIAVRGYFSPAPAMRCVPSGFVANPVRLECPDAFQWLLDTPAPLGQITRTLPSGRAGFQPILPFLDTSALGLNTSKASAGERLVEVVFIGHFHDRRGHPNLCGTGNDADCDGFVVDGIESIGGEELPPSTVIDLEPYAQEVRREPTWTSADVDRLLLAAVPDLEILSRVALPGHRIRELEPALGTGALGIIDRPIAWVVTGLHVGAGGSALVRRTFLLVDNTAEAYETVPWDVANVGFVPFTLVGTPLAPSPSPVTLDLVDATGRHLSVEIADESGLLVSAAPIAPGAWPPDLLTPGSDVAVSQVAGHPNEIHLGWVGGACDGPMRFTIRADGRTILAEQGPWEGDGDSFCILVGIQRGITLIFSAPVPASEVEVEKSSAPSSPAPAESPTVSTVVGEPITVSEALERRDSQLDDTEIAVRGFVWNPPDVTCQLSLGRPKSPLLPLCPGDLSLLAEGPQPASSSPEVPQPAVPALSLVIRPETYLGERITRAEPPEVDPVEVIAIGHFDDHRAAQCPADQITTCRRTFVVDALLDTEHPGLDLNAIEAIRPDPSIQTVATAADAELVATAAPRGAGSVLAAFAVAGSAVASFEPQAAESNELTSATAVWIVRYVDVGIEEQRPVLKTKLIIDGPIDSLAGSVYVPTPGGLMRSRTIID